MKPEVIAIISAPGVGASFLTRQLACRHNSPAFFEGEEGIFTPEILSVLNSETDSYNRYDWLTTRTKEMLEKAHKIKGSGITSFVDGDVLLMEAWLEAEIGDKSPEVLSKWIEGDQDIKADKVLVLTASSDKIERNIRLRGRESEQTEFIKARTQRIKTACEMLTEKYKHAILLDRTNLEFTETETLETIATILNPK